jgi:hypothetical protein
MAEIASRTTLLLGEQEIAPLRRRWKIAAVIDGILALGIVAAAATSGSPSPAAATPAHSPTILAHVVHQPR